jgi:hypothetical protein
MGEIVNLRRARKEKTRATASKEADAARAKSGRIRAACDAAGQTRALEDKRLAGHKREAATNDDQTK